MLDLKTDNLMLSLEDDSMLADFAKAEEDHPTPYKKIDESRSIYRSCRFRPPRGGKGYGLPILCDFGEARIGPTQETGPPSNRIFIEPRKSFSRCLGEAPSISGTSPVCCVDQNHTGDGMETSRS